jgi:ubiquinone/menaquinone biosynthesis C-methylase UbiE
MSDFSEVKQRQAAAWSAGKFEEVAPSIGDVHASVVEALGPRPGERWLDVACGAGHVSELAAAAGAVVTGIDISPRLIDVAQARAAAGGYEIDYRVGDAENLDVGDASFDAVSSSFGMIFAPDHEAAARELARVLPSGGRLAVSAWTPEGSIGDMFRALGSFQPPPPPGAGMPLQWGNEDYVRERLGDTFELTVERRLSTQTEDEPVEELWAQFSQHFGPIVLLRENLDPERYAELEQTMLGLMRARVRPDGRYVDEREYLLVSGIRR